MYLWRVCLEESWNRSSPTPCERRATCDHTKCDAATGKGLCALPRARAPPQTCTNKVHIFSFYFYWCFDYSKKYKNQTLWSSNNTTERKAIRRSPWPQPLEEGVGRRAPAGASACAPESGRFPLRNQAGADAQCRREEARPPPWAGH